MDRHSISTLLAAGLFAAGPVLGLGEPPPLDWVATFDGGGQPFATDVVSDLAVNDAGEICVTGFSATTGGASGAMTILYESDGSERWRHSYVAPDTAGIEEGLRVFLDPDGRCFVAGRSSNFATGPDVLLLSYHPEGGLDWSAIHDGPSGGFDSAVDVATDSAGNVFALALVTGAGSGWDFATLKYGPDGQPLWARTFDGPAGSDDQPVGLAVDAAGSVYVAGHARVAPPFVDDIVLIKYGPDGETLWTRFLDGGAGGSDQAAGVALSAAGDPYVAGRLRLPGGEWQAAVVKLHADGTDDWAASTGHPVTGIQEVVHDLVVGDDGSAYVVFTASNDVLTTRFDPRGGTVWRHLEDGVSLSSDAARPLAVDAAGNAYVVAWDFLPVDGIEFLTYRLAATDGVRSWQATFGEPGEGSEDFPRAIAVGPLGEVLVAGTTQPDGAQFESDWAVLEYGGPLLFADGFESGDSTAWSFVAHR